VIQTAGAVVFAPAFASQGGEMSNLRNGRLALAVSLGVLLGGLSGLAVAQEQTAEMTPAEDAALDRFCDEPGTCTVVSGYADPAASEDAAMLATAAEMLADGGKPPSACPDARDAYGDAGADVDAFVGPCPAQVPAGDPAGEPK
jgi:hypothetical protein